MALHKDGHPDRLQPRCRPCLAAAQRRSRQRKKLPNLKKAKREVLQASLTAEELLELLKALVRLSGGWQSLLDVLTPLERGELALVTAELATQEEVRAQERQRQRALDEAELRSPEMQADLLNMAIEAAREHPLRITRVIAAGRHRHMLLKALTESEQGREVLERAGWHQTGNCAL